MTETPELPDPAAAFAAGLRAYSTQFGIPEDEVYPYLSDLIGPELARDGVIATGTAWSLGYLSWRERNIATITVMISTGGVEDRLKSHFRWARANGISFDELEQLLRFLVGYVGMPKVTVAMEQLRAVMAESADAD